ncbi:MAG: hypothetical protein NVS9B5_27900 [Terriglobales bacterium]
MRRFIITGAPGAGKTAIIRQLELDGFSVVEEAAADVLVEVTAWVYVFQRDPIKACRSSSCITLMTAPVDFA